MNPVRAVRRHLANVRRSRQLLEEIREGVANLADVTNRHMIRLAELIAAAIEEPEQSSPSDRPSRLPDAPRSNGAAGNGPIALASSAVRRSPGPGENDLGSRRHILEAIVPWSGTPPPGFLMSWLGVAIDQAFRAHPDLAGGTSSVAPVVTNRPTLANDAEGWFEAINQVEAARDARGRFVMVTLGACFGFQAVSSAFALRKLNPMPFKLVAVEPEPANHAWIARHFRDNDIDPDEHWLIQAAISDTNSPVLFPVGAPRTGTQNCFASDHISAREHYVRSVLESGRHNEALRSLLTRNTTGLKQTLLPGTGYEGEISLLSAMTLADILSPLPRVDYLEADIQRSEILVFPPFMELLKRKVRRIHIGTHGKDVHDALSNLFRRDGWRIVFDFEPNSSHTHGLEAFELNDGVLTVLNPHLV